MDKLGVNKQVILAHHEEELVEQFHFVHFLREVWLKKPVPYDVKRRAEHQKLCLKIWIIDKQDRNIHEDKPPQNGHWIVQNGISTPFQINFRI